jgi:hypothetical protein
MTIKIIDAHITAESFSRAAKQGHAPTEEVAKALARLEIIVLAYVQAGEDNEPLMLTDALINECVSVASIRRRYLAEIDGKTPSVPPATQSPANA